MSKASEDANKIDVVTPQVERDQEEKMPFTIKDSGVREEFASGMVRDTGEDKTRYNRCLDGPMFRRWAEHLGKGAKKYPDILPGVPNWTLASGERELQRFKESAFGHMIDWLEGKTDEDHGAAVFFNINGAEHVKEVLDGQGKGTEKKDPTGSCGS